MQGLLAVPVNFPSQKRLTPLSPATNIVIQALHRFIIFKVTDVGWVGRVFVWQKLKERQIVNREVGGELGKRDEEYCVDLAAT